MTKDRKIFPDFFSCPPRLFLPSNKKKKTKKKVKKQQTSQVSKVKLSRNVQCRCAFKSRVKCKILTTDYSTVCSGNDTG